MDLGPGVLLGLEQDSAHQKLSRVIIRVLLQHPVQTIGGAGVEADAGAETGLNVIAGGEDGRVALSRLQLAVGEFKGADNTVAAAGPPQPSDRFIGGEPKPGLLGRFDRRFLLRRELDGRQLVGVVATGRYEGEFAVGGELARADPSDAVAQR